jgi:hypothetical protein
VLGQGIPGHAHSNQETTSRGTQEATKATRTCRPLSERQNWYKNSGMHNSLRNDSSPCKRSAHGLFAHSTPTALSVTSNIGSPPAGTKSTRRSEETSIVGINARSHNRTRIPVAEVDHGSEIASATARMLANRTKSSRLNARTLNDPLVLSKKDTANPHQSRRRCSFSVQHQA